MNPVPLLPNHLLGRWQTATGNGSALFYRVLRAPWPRGALAGLDLAQGLAAAREQGGAVLRALARLPPPKRCAGHPA